VKIKKSLETPEGNVEFSGEISSDELDLILTVGLNFLLQQGAIPFKVLPTELQAKMGQGSESQQ